MKSNTIKTKLYRYRYILLIPILGVLFYFIAIEVVHPIAYPNRDFFTFWLAGHLVKLGLNPYKAELWIEGHHLFGATWIPNQTFIYPLPLSLLFVPLSFLPLYQAYVVWIILTQFMILFSIWLLFRLSQNIQINHFILFFLAVGLIARSVTTTLTHGQLSGFLLLLIVCTIYFWERGKWWQGAILLPILALKPNLGVPIIALLFVYLFQQRRITSLVAAGISGLVLISLGFVQNPTWLIEFWEAGNSKLSQTFGFSPTIWGATSFFCEFDRNCTIGYGVGVGLLSAGCFYLLVRKKSELSPMIVVGFAIAIMLITTPYTWPYDQLLLIAPVISVILWLVDKSRIRFIVASSVFFVTSVVSMVMVKVTVNVQMEIWNVAIPLLVVILLTWCVVKGDRELSIPPLAG